MISFKNNWLVQWAVAGLLLGIGFVLPVLWWLGLVGVIGVIHLGLREPSTKQALIGGLVAWMIKSAMALVWFWSVYPLEWIEVDLGYLQLVLIFTWWFTAALWLGFGGVLFVGACRALLRYTSRSVTYLAIPFVWIIAEMFGSLIFSIITIGPGGSITTAFSFGYIGYLLAHHGLLIQTAQVYGVYALGILSVSISVFLYWSLQSVEYRKYGYVFLLGILLTSFISLPAQQSADDVYTVAVIDTNFGLQELRTQDGRREVQRQMESAVQAAFELEPDYILLPEDARYFDQQSDTNLVAAQFAFRTENSDVIIVDSGRADENEKAVVQSFVYNGQSNVVDQSHKRYLVPQGEFMPALYASALKLFGNNQVVDQFAQTVAFEVGSQTSQSEHAVTSPGVLFCFESVSPWGVRTVLRERGSVPFIAHPISHAWFNEPQSLWNQLTTMLQVQAIWNQQYIVSAGNGVSSQVFAPNGFVTYPEPISKGENWQLHTVSIPK